MHFVSGSGVPDDMLAARSAVDDSFLKIVDLRKSYSGQIVVDGLSLSIRKGEFVSILGPSGCGKTTTLRMVAGFIEPEAGHIAIAGRNIDNVPTHKRGAAMVFQNYALFPHMTVFDNVAFGLVMQNLPKEEIRRRVGENLALVRLETMAQRYPKQLSGGQQQRVALARAVVLNPQVLLLDEPLSNLDAKLRKELRAEFLEIHRACGITTLFVTHDLEEAFSLSDRVAVMNAGRLEQYGTPTEIFNSPATPFVADFVGHANILRGTLRQAADGGAEVACDSIVVKVDLAVQRSPRPVRIVVPGQAVQVSTAPTGADNDFIARVERVSFIGPRVLMRLDVCGHLLSFELASTRVLLRVREGSTVHLGFSRDEVVLVPDTGITV